MIVIQGKGVSEGIAQGEIHFLHRRDEAVVYGDAQDAEYEWERFCLARRIAVSRLEKLAEKCRTQTGEEAASLFEAHAMLAQDADYEACVRELIEEQGCNAEYAVQQAGERFARMFADMDDAYMRAREADVRDVSRKIINALTDAQEEKLKLDAPVILAVDDLSPSETVLLEKSKVLGFVTRYGSVNGHTAILARSLGIPAVCGAGAALKEEYEGRLAYMDGQSGQIFLEPEETILGALLEKRAGLEVHRKRLEGLKEQEDVTLDGRRIHLCCNIASTEELEAALDCGAQGVGLFRSEFLYLSAKDYPSEEEQFRAYKAVAEAMNGRRAVIRTLDVGADKQAAYFDMKQEENPALGLRGVRVCLNRPELFRTQLRAIYRASAYGRLAILFPMIASLWELRECKRMCSRVMEELRTTGVSYDAEMEIGVMIETPASVFIAQELAREADFFSIGTNDLTQYILACDRQNDGLDRFFDPHHPALMRALKWTADAAHRAGIRVGICGELAADLDMLDAFLAMGIDELSVTPASVLPLRARIRESVAETCRLNRFEPEKR